jgi:hypothetical protein
MGAMGVGGLGVGCVSGGIVPTGREPRMPCYTTWLGVNHTCRVQRYQRRHRYEMRDVNAKGRPCGRAPEMECEAYVHGCSGGKIGGFVTIYHIGEMTR